MDFKMALDEAMILVGDKVMSQIEFFEIAAQQQRDFAYNPQLSLFPEIEEFKAKLIELDSQGKLPYFADRLKRVIV